MLQGTLTREQVKRLKLGLTDTDEFGGDLAAANRNTTAGRGLVVPPGATAWIAANQTIDRPVVVLPGGRIKTNGFTLTITGAFEAGLVQAFDLSGGGAVVLSEQEGRLEWFGFAVTATAAANKAAANAAFVSGPSEWSVGPGTFPVTTGVAWPNTASLVAYKGLRLKGAGMEQTIFEASGAGTLFEVKGQVITGTGSPTAGQLYGVGISDMTIKGEAGQVGIALKRYIIAQFDRLAFRAKSGTAGFDSCVQNSYNFFNGVPREDDYNALLIFDNCYFGNFKNYGYDSAGSTSSATPQIEVFRSCWWQGREPTDWESLAGIRSSAHILRVEGGEIISTVYGIHAAKASGATSIYPEAWDIHCRFEGQKTAGMYIEDGDAFVVSGIFDCHHANEASWHPTPILIPDGATNLVRSVTVVSPIFYPVYVASDFAWQAVYAGTNLNGTGFVNVINPKTGTMPPSGVRVAGSKSANVSWIEGTRFKALAAGSEVFGSYVDGESQPRVRITGGHLLFGDGTLAPSAQINYRGVDIAGPNNGDHWQVEGTWDGGKLYVGVSRVWRDADGFLHYTSSGDPASDTANFYVQAAVGGSTANRPATRPTGWRYFDTTLGMPVWWNGTAWTTGHNGTPENFANADATPTVLSRASNFVEANTGATTITDFDDDLGGQEITVLFTTANTTVQHNANIKLAGGVDFVGSANDVLTLVARAGVWYEKCRSVNG